MSAKNRIKPEGYPIFLVSIQWFLSFVVERKALVVNPLDHIITYLFAKVLLFVILYLFWRFICKAFMQAGRERYILKSGFPYLLLLIAFFTVAHPMSLSGDELNIYNATVKLDMYFSFTYFTGIYYLISIMIIPFQIGPVIVKLLIDSLVLGYCSYRFHQYFKKPLSFLICVLFLFPSVLRYGLAIHRMHLYGLLFLVFAVKLIFDHLEKRRLDARTFVIMAAILAVLTFWRKEGIYLLVWGFLMLWSGYHLKGKKVLLKAVAAYFVIQLLIASPQLIRYVSANTAVEEAGHTYNMWFVHMCRYGLDQEKYKTLIEDVDKVLDVSEVNRINHDLGDENFGDEYIIWLEGYHGGRSGYSPEEYKAYKSAITQIVMREPVLFIKTRLGLFDYSATKCRTLYQLPGNPLIASVLKLAGNLYIPFIVVIAALVYSLLRRKWVLAALTCSLCINTVITTFFSPAGYFKYYYQVYLIGYFILIFWIVKGCTSKYSHLTPARNSSKKV